MLDWLTYTIGPTVAGRKTHLNAQAALGRRVHGESCAVSVGYGPDDGQAKSVPAAVDAADGVQPLEGLEEPVDLPRRDRRAAIGDRQNGAAVLLSGGDLDRTAGNVVMHGVVEEVGGQALDEVQVAQQGCGTDRRLDVEPPGARSRCWRPGGLLLSPPPGLRGRGG